MGTLVEITIQESDNDLAQHAINKSFNEMSRLEKIMSTYLPNSELSKLNTTLDVEINGKLHLAHVTDRPLYDANGGKMKN